MSLEQIIAEQIAATKENTAVLKELLATTADLRDMRAEAIETVRSTAGGAAAKKADKASASDPKPNISASPEDRKDPANPEDDLRLKVPEAVASYLSATDRAEEREARKAEVKKLLNNDKIRKPSVEKGAAKSAEDIQDDAVALFLDQIEKRKAKGDITTPPPAPAAADDDLV